MNGHFCLVPRVSVHDSFFTGTVGSSTTVVPVTGTTVVLDPTVPVKKLIVAPGPGFS